MPEALDDQEVARKEARWKPVENEKPERSASQVVKTADLSACKIRRLEGSLLELP
jgi:hypothetical protein